MADVDRESSTGSQRWPALLADGTGMNVERHGELGILGHGGTWDRPGRRTRATAALRVVVNHRRRSMGRSVARGAGGRQRGEADDEGGGDSDRGRWGILVQVARV